MGVHPAEWSPTLGRGLAMPGGPTESPTGGAHTRQTPIRHAHLRDPRRRGGGREGTLWLRAIPPASPRSGRNQNPAGRATDRNTCSKLMCNLRDTICIPKTSFPVRGKVQQGR